MKDATPGAATEITAETDQDEQLRQIFDVDEQDLQPPEKNP